MKQFLSILILLSLVLVCGCSGTIPVNYSAQNFIRYSGQVDIGQFTYQPAIQGKVRPNQMQSTAIGSIFIALNISELVQRATALELEKTGFDIGDKHPLQICGDVLEFKADDLGYSVTWTYAVRYKIIRKTDSSIVLDKVYTTDPVKTGKFGMAKDYAPSVNEMIRSGYNMFIKDSNVKTIFSEELLDE